MKASLNWIRFLNDKYHTSAEPAPDGVDKLIDKIGLQLGAVEEVINLGERYTAILVAKVVSAEIHPNADKLKICLIDDGRANKKVKRNDKGLIQVVCGAANVKAGQLVAWIPPGATVPSTFDKDPFTLEARDIRGQISNGMIASAKELAISDEPDGILIIDQPAKPGQPFADVYGLNDYIIDIENKMFTHRPDLFGQLGIAREIAGIQQQVFKSPAWYKEDIKLDIDGRNNSLKLQIKNDLPQLVPRFCALVIKDVKVRPSPVFIQARLASVGIRPINNIVDITNFLMMESAQPLHAYDYDKIKSGTLGIRLSRQGESLKLLGGKLVKLSDGAIVITDGQSAIGLGGVMGGVDTQVDEHTQNIILECANFDMNLTRKTAMAYGLFTEAATRFTKDQSPCQNLAVIARAADDVLKIAGGRICGQPIDDKHFLAEGITVKLDAEFVNSRLGLDLSTAQIKEMLENVEFDVTVSGQNLSISAPFWRTDIHIPEDITEEVGRLYGYDKLPVVLPKRDLSPAQKNEMLQFKSRLRDIMCRSGANEVLTYSFVHEKLLKAAGQDPKEAYHIRNAVSPDLQFYRMNLAPSLLEKVHANQRLGFEQFGLFEIGIGHVKDFLDEQKLPAEIESIAAAVVDPYTKGAPYFTARRLADNILEKLYINDVSYQPLKEAELKRQSTLLNCYEPGRSAIVWIGKRPAGMIGEPTTRLRQSLKLPAATAMFELDIPALYDKQQAMLYRQINKFPSSTQDICLKISKDIPYAHIDDFIWENLERLSKKDSYYYMMSTIDIFQRPEAKNYQQITWRIELSRPDRTLTTPEVNKILNDLAEQAKKEFKAERI